ncbi:MAG: hypothetical protein V4650_14485 [Pseudomonadota bacterium]
MTWIDGLLPLLPVCAYLLVLTCCSAPLRIPAAREARTRFRLKPHGEDWVRTQREAEGSRQVLPESTVCERLAGLSAKGLAAFTADLLHHARTFRLSAPIQQARPMTVALYLLHGANRCPSVLKGSEPIHAL